MSTVRQSPMRPELVPDLTDTPRGTDSKSRATVLPTDESVDSSNLTRVAGLIDVVAGHDPSQLSTLLAILWDGGFKEEARSVLDAALVCRDPLSDLGAICADALTTLADVDKLIRAEHWTGLVAVTGHTDSRACALLNVCEHRIASLTNAKQASYRAVRARLEAAAQLERQARSADIRAVAGLRLARCPRIWALYEKWRDTE